MNAIVAGAVVGSGVSIAAKEDVYRPAADTKSTNGNGVQKFNQRTFAWSFACSKQFQDVAAVCRMRDLSKERPILLWRPLY